jgi:hypothetical protein
MFDRSLPPTVLPDWQTTRMPRGSVQVEGDHLERLAGGAAVKALAELIWNGLDAEATRVSVVLEASVLAGREAIGEIAVIDNGHGIPREKAEEFFEHLGGSWKAFAGGLSQNKRVPLHGHNGQGRFKALALGSSIEWASVVVGQPRNLITYITIDRSSLKYFDIQEQAVPTDDSPGTTVTVRNPAPGIHGLLDLDRTVGRLTSIFALHLMRRPELEILIGGRRVDPTSLQNYTQTYPLAVATPDGLPAELDVIEWSMPVERSLHLCDSEGISLYEMSPGVQAPTFNFTAYIRWQGYRERASDLALGGSNDELEPIVEAARERLREHFRVRSSQRDGEVVRHWIAENSYPYRGEPTNESAVVERQVFDLTALTLNAASPSFGRSDAESRRVTLRLLREAVERSPASVHRILQEVARLDVQRLDELATLLERTPLAKIIAATREVTDRLTFLDALEILLFEYTKELGERDQLHKILESELWIFGDHFEQALSERGLTNVLREHIKVLGRDDLVTEPVRQADGSLARVDLMLSASVAGRGTRRAEHLVVELKAPHVKIGTSEIGQIENYATAVLDDPRFYNHDTYWEFWLLGNELDAAAQRRIDSNNNPETGLIQTQDNHRIWVLQWSRMLSSQRRRLQFMRDRLEHSSNEEEAIGYLRKTHSGHLPEPLALQDEPSSLLT